MVSPHSIHPSLLHRKIIHIDMDAFYASVEMRDNPALRDKPIAVGGRPGTRSVVSTANYAARKFGVRSAMASDYAAKLCPGLIFVPPRFSAYEAVSQQIRSIFAKYSSLVEPMSLDEAYLDVTDHPELLATEIARRIKAEIFATTELTASAGVAPNKMLAKIASDMQKPNGLTLVLPKDAFAFMQPLPIGKIPFVGPKTTARLKTLGITHCRDVLSHTPESLEAELGSLGPWLWERSQGIDDRPVEISYERKSYGSETTYLKDILTKEEANRELTELANNLCQGLKNDGLLARTLTVKAKYHDFVSVTRAKTIPTMTNDPAVMVPIFLELLAKTEAGKKPIRLLGVSVKSLSDATPEAADPNPQNPPMA